MDRGAAVSDMRPARAFALAEWCCQWRRVAIVPPDGSQTPTLAHRLYCRRCDRREHCLGAPATDGNEWRVGVYLRVPGAAPRPVRALSAYQTEEELRRRVMRGRVRLGTDGRDVVFLYTPAQDVALAAQQAASDLLAEHGMPAQIVVECWHPIARQWEPADAPVLDDEAAARGVRAQQDAAETRESLILGAAMYEVRVELSSHRQVVELAARLAADGYSVVKRWRFLVVGANNADQAAEFEAAIRLQVPEGVQLSVYNQISPWPHRSDL